MKRVTILESKGTTTVVPPPETVGTTGATGAATVENPNTCSIM